MIVRVGKANPAGTLHVYKLVFIALELGKTHCVGMSLSEYGRNEIWVRKSILVTCLVIV